MEEGHKKVSVIIKQERVTMKQADVLKLTLWFLELCKIVIGIKGKKKRNKRKTDTVNRRLETAEERRIK